MLKAKETILTSLSCMIWKPLLQLFSSVEILLITPTFYVLEILSWYSQWCCFFNDDKEQISWDNKISWLFQQHFFRSRWQIWQSTTFTQQTKCLSNYLSEQTVTIDESVLTCFDRHGCKQFMKNKPVKFGYKL